MNKSFASPFGRKLKKLRLEHGIAQKDLAEELGISRSCLANYENGNRQPDNDMLVRIADRFHVLIDYLVDRTEARNLSLSMREIDEFNRIKHKYQDRDCTLDLSDLELEGKIAVIRYYHFIEDVERIKS
ncbi:MAG: helix-turn-helix transcriptional regulator [Clostridia bacterium]|nr:helix-turn-helix transcriptional regulator [Clostridia bacterium]